MPIEILMPALSPTMTEGKLAKWTKSEGDTVSPGDVIAEIETDKATMEVEAVEDGTIGKIIIPAGTENVAVNTAIAILLEEGESADDIANMKASSPAPSETPVQNDTPVAQSTTSQPIGEDIDNRDILYAQGKVIQPPKFDEESFWNDTEETTVREALRKAMSTEMRNDDSIYVMGEEVAEYNGAYKITQGMLDEFGERRIIDTPITEHGFTGLAVGSAFKGCKPIVEFMTFNFAMQAIDHLINSAAKTLYMSGGQLGCQIVFRGANGAASRVGAQHSQCYAAWYSHIPGLKVVSPWSAADAYGLMKAAIRDPNPVIFLENELMYGKTFECPTSDEYIIPLGRAKIEREGSDVTITAFSIMVSKAMYAADILAEQGINAEVINLRTIRPLDRHTILESVKKTNRIVSCEEGFPQNGVGSEIAALIGEHAFDYLDAPLERVCAKDVPLPYAANLEQLALPQVDDIVNAAKRSCYKD